MGNARQSGLELELSPAVFQEGLYKVHELSEILLITIINRVRRIRPFIPMKLLKSIPSTTILMSMAFPGLSRSAIRSISIHSPVGYPGQPLKHNTKSRYVVNLFTALNYLGIPTEFDQAEGITAGAVLVPTDLDPINQTRSDARRAYFDPYAARNNFHVITGQHVTRVLIQGLSTSQTTGNPTTGGNDDGTGPLNANTGGFGFGPGSIPPTNTSSQPIRRDYGPSKLRITGVEVAERHDARLISSANTLKFASSASSPRQTVYATREVIIAAGALHSVQLMQLSGIGPAALLQQLNITVALDLPGVGNNYQDHCLVGTFYPCKPSQLLKDRRA